MAEATSWIWKQHDTWPPGLAVLKAPNAVTGIVEVIDLTTATEVKIVARAKTASDPTAPFFKVKVTVVEATAGLVSYTPIEAHTETVQELNAEFEINWGSGKIQSVPVTGYFLINITDDLG